MLPCTLSYYYLIVWRPSIWRKLNNVKQDLIKVEEKKKRLGVQLWGAADYRQKRTS